MEIQFVSDNFSHSYIIEVFFLETDDTIKMKNINDNKLFVDQQIKSNYNNSK